MKFIITNKPLWKLKYKLIQERAPLITRRDDPGSYRIVALRDIVLETGTVIKKGTKGGLVDGMHNLSQDGNCWIFPLARAGNNARVKDSAILAGEAFIRMNVTLEHHALVGGNAYASGNDIRISGGAKVYGRANVGGTSRIYQNARVRGDAVLAGHSCIGGNAIIQGTAYLHDAIYGDNSVIGLEEE